MELCYTTKVFNQITYYAPAMKALLIAAGTVTTVCGIGLFLICPTFICRTPQGYARWVQFQFETSAEVISTNLGL
jgi:hypothetical protein